MSITEGIPFTFHLGFVHPLQDLLSYLSRSLADRWGTTVDFTTSFLHCSQFSGFHSMILHSRPVHSLMLSSHRLLCLPLHLPPWIVPCRALAFHCFLSNAFLFQVVPSLFAMSSRHLLIVSPLDFFPLLGCHSVQCLVHLFSFFQIC